MLRVVAFLEIEIPAQTNLTGEDNFVPHVAEDLKNRLIEGGRGLTGCPS